MPDRDSAAIAAAKDRIKQAEAAITALDDAVALDAVFNGIFNSRDRKLAFVGAIDCAKKGNQRCGLSVAGYPPNDNSP